MRWFCVSVSIFLFSVICHLSAVSVSAQPLVNLPNFGAQSRMNEAAVFWFGQVNNTANYADIRFGYTDTTLKVYTHIMDRYLWYDTTPDVSTLTDYDAVSVYLSTSPSPPATISPTEYRFVGQLNWWEAESNYQAVYHGTNLGNWDIISAPLVIESNWRGNAPNDTIDDRGWTQFFTLPYSILGMDQTPPLGTTWHLGLIVHDRDEVNSGPEAVQVWPTNFDPRNPTTWATLHFGPPAYSLPSTQNPRTYTIRQDSTHTVIDAHVGGHTDCGGDSAPDFFPTWGNRNYASYEQISEQNQWDVADWPCFSKMLFRFPLTDLPLNKIITQATLTLHQFGNSDPSQAQPSYIQVLTTSTPWDEATVNWNNTPPAQENIASAWVDPVSGAIVWPGWRRDWDLTYGLAKAYAQHQTEFSLVLYSADGAYHSGKYFTSSDVDEWDLAGRPTLTIVLADPVTPLRRDLNGDGVVDLLDVIVLISNFNANGLGNFNLNQVIDIFDLNTLINSL